MTNHEYSARLSFCLLSSAAAAAVVAGWPVFPSGAGRGSALAAVAAAAGRLTYTIILGAEGYIDIR